MNITTTSKFSENFGIKVLIFGQAGSGKTYAASTLSLEEHKPLIISAESGLLSLRDFDIPVFDISKNDKGDPLDLKDRIPRLVEVFNFIKSGKHEFKTIYLDSLTEVNQCLLAALKVKYPDRKDTLPMFGENAETMMKLVKEFRDLKYNVVITALASVEKDDIGRRFLVPDVVGKFAQSLPQLFDEVFYLSSKIGEDGKPSRVFQTSSSENVIAKDRSGALDLFEPPNLSEIFKKIKAKKEQKKEQINQLTKTGETKNVAV